MTEASPAVMIDNGTGMMKGGVAGEDAPKSCFPTILGRPTSGHLIGTEDREVFLGYEAQEKAQVLELDYPIEGGAITNWDDMIKIWSYLYYTELKADPTEQPVHIAENAQRQPGGREKTMEIMFEDFSVPAFYISMQSVLSLYASGKTLGLVIDSGEGMTSIVPVYEACAMRHAVCNVKLAGKDLTQSMSHLLQEAGIDLGPSHQVLDTAKMIKEQGGYVSMDFEDNMRAFAQGEGREFDYTLPDGNTVRLGSCLTKCPEVMFNPSMLGKDFGGVHQLAYSVIQKCDPDLHRDLFGNLLLSGGSTMFGNYPERLHKEVSALVPSMKVRVTAPDERKYSPWIGGSILSVLATFQTMWVLRQEYDEVGPSVVHRKCI